MARVTSNPDCNCNTSFQSGNTLLGGYVHLSQVQTSSEQGSVCAVFLFLGRALQMQQARVTPALLRMQLPPIKPDPTQSTIRVPLWSHQRHLEKVSLVSNF